ncbi:MAG: CCA tRNA nucleotidyltransferase [Spirulinaceae cyanobacterium SM2_1_0]|nr:CCA tRNA nucleotidyltransferase [Spirulinaceae cyanobacterium SM2_1_0]
MALNSDLRPFVARLPFSLDLLPPAAYLVGGSVRDALLGRQVVRFDFDFVLPVAAVATARQIADHHQAGFVVLDAARQIARVVFAEGTVDFAQQEGESLEQDLRRRDFRCNAIAYDPRTHELIDPLNGCRDLARGELQAISRANLSADPLRLLRAYRQAAQLDFAIAPKTRSLLRSLAPQLKTVAGERVQAELNYLLQAPKCNPWLAAAWEDGLFASWLPELNVAQVSLVDCVDQAAWLLGRIWVDLDAQLQAAVGNKSVTWLTVAKLSVIAGTPVTAAANLERLKYSRLEQRAVSGALQSLPSLLAALETPLSLREQYFWFQTVGDLFPLVAVLAVATIARREPLRETRAVAAIAPLVNRYLDPESQITHPTPLLTGDDLIRELSLSPSPQIGHLLTEIQLARIEGKIATVAEALQFAATQLESV